jgi:uncharacterized OB-fold protein
MTHEATALAIDLATLSVAPPTPTALSSSFWKAAADKRLIFHHCTDCGSFTAYPREICPRCWSQNQVWKEVSGQAHVQTFTRVHQAGNGGWQLATPFYIALVRLTEGPVILTQLIEAGRPVYAGATCHVAFTQVGEWTLPFFRLTGDSEAVNTPEENS